MGIWREKGEEKWEESRFERARGREWADRGGCCVRMRRYGLQGGEGEGKGTNWIGSPNGSSHSERRARPQDIVITQDIVYLLPRITAVNIGYYCITDERLESAGIP